MGPVTLQGVRLFLQRLSERYAGAGEFYLLGGSALCLLGSSRETRDIDYTVELPPHTRAEFEQALSQLANEMQLDVEHVPLAEFIPLPPRARERRRMVGRFGQLDVYLFDLYSIALSKIARGFEADLEDVMFMLNERLIDLSELEKHFDLIIPRALQSDIDPEEFRGYFQEIRRRATRR
ncbi:MAG: hypothetical protein EYC68_22455 [Chloroflexota bacterium]|nr:MAG: hypothetical protein EYC68_22455 [Chloroflexota bacterium]